MRNIFGSKTPISDEIAHLSLFVINGGKFEGALARHVPLSPKNAKCVPFWIQRVDATESVHFPGNIKYFTAWVDENPRMYCFSSIVGE